MPAGDFPVAPLRFRGCRFTTPVFYGILKNSQSKIRPRPRERYADMTGRKKKKKSKSRFRIWWEYILFWLMYRILRALPLKCGYRFSALLMGILFRIDGTHSGRSVQHVLHSGIVGDDAAAARKLAKQAFVESGKLLSEVAKSDKLFRQEEFVAEAPEATLDYVLADRNPDNFDGLIMVTAHFGNWEIAGTALTGLTGRRLTSLMRPFSNPKIGEIILRHRSAPMVTLADKKLGIRPLLRALNHHEIAVILIDQHAAGSEGVVCEFFGHPARVHMTPALLHLKTGIPIMPEVTTRLPGEDFRFAMTAGELIRYTPTGDREKDVLTVTQMCISALEKLIRKHPEQGLWAPRHWLDIHRGHDAEYANWKPKIKVQGLSVQEFKGRGEA